MEIELDFVIAVKDGTQANRLVDAIGLEPKGIWNRKGGVTGYPYAHSFIFGNSPKSSGNLPTSFHELIALLPPHLDQIHIIADEDQLDLKVVCKAVNWQGHSFLLDTASLDFLANVGAEILFDIRGGGFGNGIIEEADFSFRTKFENGTGNLGQKFNLDESDIQQIHSIAEQWIVMGQANWQSTYVAMDDAVLALLKRQEELALGLEGLGERIGQWGTLLCDASLTKTEPIFELLPERAKRLADLGLALELGIDYQIKDEF